MEWDIMDILDTISNYANNDVNKIQQVIDNLEIMIENIEEEMREND